jgi:hypothetical protein
LLLHAVHHDCDVQDQAINMNTPEINKVHAHSQKQFCAMLRLHVLSLSIWLFAPPSSSPSITAMGATFSGSSAKCTSTFRDVLGNDGILQHIFGFVGAGHWLFLAKVSKQWKRVYSRVRSLSLKSRFRDWERSISCSSTQTLCSAAFAAASTLRLAYECGLELGAAADKEPRSLHHRWLLTRAGEYADINILQLAHNLGMPWTKEVAVGVVQSKCLAKLQWLYPQLHSIIDDDDDDPYNSDDSSDNAADTENARPKKIKGWCSDDLLGTAAAYGALDIVQWLLQLDIAVGDSAYDAALAGHLSVLQLVYRDNCRSEELLCSLAAGRADLDMLNWLHARDCSLGEADELACQAARAGSTEVLAWLQQLGAVHFSGEVMHVAARNGNTAVCVWLRAQGCAWDASPTVGAARANKLDTLKWLYEHDCPCDWSTNEDSTAVEAACGGSPEMLQYCLEQGAVWSAEQLTTLLQAAGSTDSLANAKWLRQQGAEWPAVLSRGSYEWEGEVLEWARAEGCTSPVTPVDAEPAAEMQQ